MEQPKIINAKFKVIHDPNKPRWRYDWRPLLGAAIIGLPALLKALLAR